MAELGAPVVDLLAPVRGERILDLGCGDGHLTAEIAARGCAVIGVDASPELVAAARARGLDVRLQDAQALDLPERFDAVFSNAALHWMKNAAAVIHGVHRHLRAGGRFVGEMGGHGNVAAIVTALVAVLARRGIDARPLHPWQFPTEAAWRALLEGQGLRVETIALIPRPTPLPTGMDGWLRTFAAPFLQALPAGQRDSATAEAVALLAPALCDPTGAWIADYVRLRFRAVRPG